MLKRRGVVYAGSLECLCNFYEMGRLVKVHDGCSSPNLGIRRHLVFAAFEVASIAAAVPGDAAFAYCCRL